MESWDRMRLKAGRGASKSPLKALLLKPPLPPTIGLPEGSEDSEISSVVCKMVNGGGALLG